MGGSDPRVLVVTSNASLVIGLTFSHRGWDVASQTPDAETPLDGDVIVFDLGTTRAGLEAAAGLEPAGRVLVIGDEDLADLPPAGVRVLVRPYTVDDLTDRIEQLLSPAGAHAATWVDPPELERVEGEKVGPTAGDGSAAGSEDTHGSRTLPRAAATNGAPTASEAAALATSVADEVAASERMSGDASGTADRGRRVDRSEPRRSLTSRLFGRVPATTSAEPDTGDGPPAEVAAPEPEAVPEPDGAAATSSTDTVPPAVPDELGIWIALDDDLAVEVTDDDGDDAGQLHDPPAAPPPPPPPAPVTPAHAAATALLERRVIRVPEKATSVPPTVRPTRWRARRQKTGTGSERRFRERLARVLSATSELELLVEEVPLLAELPALAAAIVREVQHQLDADTVGLWRPAADGWQPVAHHGFTRNEATWVVPFDQPLFSEVHATGGALLLDPVDAVQAAVAGIGGAHTASFMAAAIAAGPGRYGILAVGRDRQLVEADLDTLGDLALEMAPGLAVAEQLARLRGAGAPTEAASPDGTGDRRSWRSQS